MRQLLRLVVTDGTGTKADGMWAEAERPKSPQTAHMPIIN